MVKLLSATELVKRTKGQFNNLQTRLDRKYFVHSVFRFLRKDLGFTVEKLVGSNQVILTKTRLTPKWIREVVNGVTFFKRAELNEPKTEILYDSENEGKLADPEKFEQFVVKQLRTVLKEVKGKNGKGEGAKDARTRRQY